MAGKLSKPFKDRFGIQYRMNFYSTDELIKIMHVQQIFLKFHVLKILYMILH